LPDHEPFHRLRSQPTLPDTLREQAIEFARCEDEKMIRFLQGVDALILDAQFDAEEYSCHTGWGHSSVDDAVDLALRAGARELFLFHHDPAHDNEKLDQMTTHARKLAAASKQGLEVTAACEEANYEFASLPRW
jgi:ribonuclease BN (tRNA processing enzyme)